MHILLILMGQPVDYKHEQLVIINMYIENVNIK